MDLLGTDRTSRCLPGQLGLRLNPDQLGLPGRHVIEIVRLNLATGQDVDSLERFGLGITAAILVTSDAGDDAIDGVGNLLLRPPSACSPCRKFHDDPPRDRFPLWLSQTLALWQYANMENGRIGYLQLVANDTQAPNRIRELREARGLAQNQLAEIINVTPSALNKLERGTRGLNQEWMRRIAKALGCAPVDILPDADNPSRLSAEEQEMLDRLRAATKRDRETLLRVSEAIIPYSVPSKAA